jgi:hypothetical protein
MRIRECATALGRDERRDDAGHQGTIARERRAQVFAFDALHRQEHLVSDSPKIEDGHDVLMREAHRQPSFANEQLEEARIRCAFGTDPLDDEQLLDTAGTPAREEHLGHATTRKGTQQLVPTHGARHPGSIDGCVAASRDRESSRVLVRKAFVAIAMIFVPHRAVAAPAADVIVVWAPGHDIAPIAAVARERGIALVDRSPPRDVPAAIDATIQRGIDAYDALKLDAAWTQFEDARRALDATGGAGVTNTRLSDLFVYRALLRMQQGHADAAWEELLAATIVAPARVFDPARFPPRTLADLDRARAATLPTQVAVAIDAPPACAIVIDGTATTARDQPLLRGNHWIAARCPAAAPWGRRIEITEANARVRIVPEPIVAPTETELLVQARTAGSRGLVVVEVRGTLASVRLLGIDGRERERRSATLGNRGLVPVATLVGDILAPRREAKWYQSRWAWAAGGALAFAALLIPIVLVLDDSQATGVKVGGPGELPP